MSTLFRENLWLHDTPTSASSRRPLSASSDSAHSPGSSTKSRYAPVFANQRPKLEPRRITAERQSRNRIKVQPIEEGTHHRALRSLEHPLSEDRHSRTARTVSSTTPKHTIPGSILLKSTLDLLLNSRRGSDSETQPAGSNRGSDRGPRRPRWKRTRSGSVWYRFQRDSSHDNESTQTQHADSLARPSEPLGILVSPLKPPVRLEKRHTGSSHHVIVETAFENPGHSIELAEETTEDYGPQEPSFRRNTPIDARKLFSISFVKLRKKSHGTHTEPEELQQSRSDYRASDVKFRSHKTFWKRDPTSALLDHVSAVLERDNLKPKRRFRSWKHKSPSETSDSQAVESRQSVYKPHGTVFSISKRHSPGTSYTVTSSIRKLHRGFTPQHSPEEVATYKVKRSPSAATEQFSKIDISIRGGTSYLPSEAHRIPTPPLPQEDSWLSDDPGPFQLAVVSELSTQKQLTQIAIPAECSVVHHVTTKCTDYGLPSGRSNVKCCVGVHTHEVQVPITVVDSPNKSRRSSAQRSVRSNSASSSSKRLQDNGSRHKNNSLRNTEAQQRQSYETELDYDIPEHLPNSPLCPRNPKYWRVVKQKGSQFRGCWMHGFGEYTVVPGSIKQVPLI